MFTYITIVSGLPRSGTSMMMKLLDAGVMVTIELMMDIYGKLLKHVDSWVSQHANAWMSTIMT